MQDLRPRKPRLPPRQELVNVLEFEDAAKIALDADVYATIAGSNRAAFDRITFRPRLMVSTLDLDLSVELFGDSHLAPIRVAPSPTSAGFIQTASWRPCVAHRQRRLPLSSAADRASRSVRSRPRRRLRCGFAFTRRATRGTISIAR